MNIASANFMNLKLAFFLLFLLNWLSVSTASALLCREIRFSNFNAFNGKLNIDTVIIPSTDLEFLRIQAKFNEGPSPQKNMASSSAKDQFHFNQESKAILNFKRQLLERDRDKIIQFEAKEEESLKLAVKEQFALFINELPEFYPLIFSRNSDGTSLTNKLTNTTLTKQELEGLSTKKAIEKLGLMVPEDLIFMKKDPTTGEFVLIGGFLAFPTNWSLNSFAPGVTIAQIHQHVAATPEASAQFAKMINTVLGRLLDAPERVVRRNNWFLEQDPRYALADYDGSTMAYTGRLTLKNVADHVSVRTERQTLRGLPQSQIVVFTIQPMVFSLKTILSDPLLASNLRDGIQFKFPDEVNDLSTTVGKFYQFLNLHLKP